MPDTAEDRELLRKWVDTWRRAGPELEHIRKRELEALNVEGATQEAIRQIFGSTALALHSPPKTTSGLVEQQMWFRRLRESAPAKHPAE